MNIRDDKNYCKEDTFQRTFFKNKDEKKYANVTVSFVIVYYYMWDFIIFYFLI